MNGKRRSIEGAEQIKLFRWIDFAAGKRPELQLLFHVPNGGSRNKAEAANLKRQGVRPGVPDLCFPVARGKYHGLYIELKAGKNKPTEHQKKWITELRAQQYAVAICYGWEEAARGLEKYLDLGGADNESQNSVK